MSTPTDSQFRPLPACVIGIIACCLAVQVQVHAQAPIVQPGPPGTASRTLTAQEAIGIASAAHTSADVRFMQDMIPHHHQAIEMAELVAERTNRQELIDVAGRIDVSQRDEIEFMQEWLRERALQVPDSTDHAAMQTEHRMAGMATPEQMAALAAAQGTDFDRLFLQLMIAHHEGAVTMVDELQAQSGAAYEPVLFEFTRDVTNDQNAEIERMSALLTTLSDDPRAGLTAGFEDAGLALMNLELVGTLPKPDGFFNPENPAELPPERPPRNSDDDDEDHAGDRAMPETPGDEARAATADHEHAAGVEVAEVASPADVAAPGALDPVDGAVATAQQAGDAEAAEAAADGEVEDDEEADSRRGWNRSPPFSFANTDMAFRDDVLVAGSYHGFNIYRLSGDGLPRQISSVVCPGGQGDVSVVGDLLIMSVEQTRARLDCGLEGIGDDVSPERFRGLRIFDISDLTRPVQVGAVQTCRGSHTHSVVSGPGADGRIIVYNSGTARIREEEELAGCIGAIPGDDRTALFRIDVIEIPVANPSAARIVSSPAVFADTEAGILAGLWRGGDHGDDTQESSRTDQCHDITVFPEKHLAAGACSGNGILFDISDPLHPRRLDAVVDKGFAYWHSATFNNDGTKVLFTDEWGGGSRPRCRAHDPLTWGADAIYDIVDDRLEFRGYFKMSAPQAEEENCVAHNGSIVPVPGRDIFVQAWYQGGISVIDFTDSAQPIEIAYFDRGPIHDKHLILGGYWSAYWYAGRIYGTEIVRGLDVLSLLPSDHLTGNEIAAASLADYNGVFNPQQQLRVDWPADPVVARAYVDQLARSADLPASLNSELIFALDSTSLRLAGGTRDVQLAERLAMLAADVAAAGADGIANRRRAALAETLNGIAVRLR